MPGKLQLIDVQIKPERAHSGQDSHELTIALQPAGPLQLQPHIGESQINQGSPRNEKVPRNHSPLCPVNHADHTPGQYPLATVTIYHPLFGCQCQSRGWLSSNGVRRALEDAAGNSRGVSDAFLSLEGPSVMTRTTSAWSVSYHWRAHASAF